MAPPCCSPPTPLFFPPFSMIHSQPSK
jgi:hypothetical protein